MYNLSFKLSCCKQLSHGDIPIFPTVELTMVEYTVVEFTYGGIYRGGIYRGGIYLGGARLSELPTMHFFLYRIILVNPPKTFVTIAR